MGHHDVSAHTLLQQCTRQIYGKGIFSLIADYSVIKLCFKILFGETIYHFVMNVLKAFCFRGVLTL